MTFESRRHLGLLLEDVCRVCIWGRELCLQVLDFLPGNISLFDLVNLKQFHFDVFTGYTEFAEAIFNSSEALAVTILLITKMYKLTCKNFTIAFCHLDGRKRRTFAV